MMDKFLGEMEGRQPPNVRQKYGFLLDENDDTTPLITLKSSVENSSSVKEYLKSMALRGREVTIETRYSLYNNYINLAKGISEIKIDETLLTAFLKYLEYDSLNDLKRALNETHPPTSYHVFYYSRGFDTSYFNLKIDYATTPHQTEMWGFHRDTKLPLFKGGATRKGFNLYMNLSCDTRGGEEFQIITSVGTITDPSEMKIMVGSFMGISSQGVPTCGECLVVKQEQGNEFIEPEGTRRLNAYFMLKRPRVNAKSSEIRTLEDITTHGVPAKDFDAIVGNYAVWGRDGGNQWFQSRLSIEPNTYISWYETLIFKDQPHLQKQRCEITITTLISKKVCITVKSGHFKGREIISFVMVDFGQLCAMNQVSNAAFITMSRHTGKSVAGYIKMLKTGEEVEAKELTSQEIEDLKQKHPELGELEKR